LSSTHAHHSDVLVVGGGVIGLACAWYLARAGRYVRIIEQGKMGEGASHGNCGLVFVSDLPPLCVPGAVRHEMLRMLRGTSPLSIKPRPDPALALWLLRFAAHCNTKHRTQAILARDALLRASGELFDRLFEEDQLDCDFERRGLLMAFTDPASMEAYAATNRLLAPFGLAATRHDRTSIHQLEPALNDKVCGGWHHEADSHLRPESLMVAWTRAALALGVTIHENCRLERFETGPDAIRAAVTTTGRFTAERFVLAAGAWTPAIGRQLGLRIPVQPGKGYSITMDRPAVCPHTPCYLYERNMVVTPWQSGYRLGGTMEFSGFDTRPSRKRLDNLEKSAALYMRTPLGSRVEERWTGLRPMSVDDLPIIGPTPGWNNLTLATGHGMIGLTTATGTGRLVADMITDRPLPFDPKPFSVMRFQ
jgi:D-amino-acid dehydrogenase